MFRKYFQLVLYLLLLCGCLVSCQQQMQPQESQQAAYTNSQDGQHASIIQPTMSNFNPNYQNRQAGFARLVFFAE